MESFQGNKYVLKEGLLNLNKIFSLISCVLVTMFMTFLISCQSNDEELIVFAAASMTDVLNEVKERYELENEVTVQYNFGASQALAVELSKGSPGDIFIPAGNSPLEFLIQRSDVVISNISTLSHNSLIVVAKSQGKEISRYSDLVGLNLISIADPNLAPAGLYAQQFLTNSGMWARIEANLIFAPDVRAALNYVKSGNVDAAIVYLTDAINEPDLQISRIIPQDFYSDISYPLVVLENENKGVSDSFAEFLLSSEIEQLFKSYGFR